MDIEEEWKTLGSCYEVVLFKFSWLGHVTITYMTLQNRGKSHENIMGGK
jgi:hypothetical protein